MTRSVAIAAANILGLCAGVLASPGCQDLRCCNSCGRAYTIGEPTYPGVSIAGLSEGGNECEIDEIPRSISDGTHTLRVRVAGVEPVGDQFQYSVEVLEQFEGDVAAAQCGGDGQEILDAQGLIEVERSVGDLLCLVDDVSAEESCTQKGCLGS